MGLFSGMTAVATGMSVNNAIDKIIKLKNDKEKNIKVMSLENIFNELKEKIDKYEELSKNTGSIEINDLEIAKIEDEIKTLKLRINELNSSIEGKSKIEKMKMTLNITSIESDITLKEIELEEEKKKAEKDYDNRVQSSNKNLENIKNNLITYIQNSEEDIEKNIKIKKAFNQQAIINLTSGEIKMLKNIGLNIPEDLVNFNLTSYDLQRLMNSCTNEVHLTQIGIFKEEIKKRGLILEEYELFFGVLEVLALFDLKQKLNPLFEKNATKLVLGTDLEEVKNYYDNIMKVEFLNLENIEKEKTERITEVEKEKLEIKKETIQNKINTVNEMVDEMIKEVIKEELKKREIVVPAFVPVTKYFNAPNEEE